MKEDKDDEGEGVGNPEEDEGEEDRETLRGCGKKKHRENRSRWI